MTCRAELVKSRPTLYSKREEEPLMLRKNLASMCRRGHWLDGDNLYINLKDEVVCRECQRNAQQRRRDRLAEAKKAESGDTQEALSLLRD